MLNRSDKNSIHNMPPVHFCRCCLQVFRKIINQFYRIYYQSIDEINIPKLKAGLQTVKKALKRLRSTKIPHLNRWTLAHSSKNIMFIGVLLPLFSSSLENYHQFYRVHGQLINRINLTQFKTNL